MKTDEQVEKEAESFCLDPLNYPMHVEINQWESGEEEVRPSKWSTEAYLLGHASGKIAGKQEAIDEIKAKDARIKALRIAITQACATPMIGKLALSILRGAVSLDDRANDDLAGGGNNG